MSCYSTFALNEIADDVLADAAERFLRRYHISKGGCWKWIGYLDGDGYGLFRISGRRVGAHRFGYELLVGPVPQGLVLDHLCRNRACVNPEHLEPVTQAENIRRGKTGQINAAKTRCPYGHPYDAANTYVIPASGGRTCRTCQHRRRREYEARQRAAQTG